jgi:Right handed beta helix region
MLTQSLRGLTVAVVAAFILGPAPAAAVTLVSACQPLGKAGETYVLTADITASSDCFLIQADRITLDLAGKTITGSGAGAGVGFLGNFTLTVVKNGSIVNFFVGIFLPGPRNTVRNVTASDNGVGIAVGSNSLVKDCTVQRNQSGGIQTGDGTQVEGCVIGGPDGDRQRPRHPGRREQHGDVQHGR